MASMSCLKAIEAGAEGIDTCLAPFAYRSSHSSSETFAVALKDTPYDPKLDLGKMSEIDDYLEEIIPPKLRSFSDRTRYAVIDIGVIMHQVQDDLQRSEGLFLWPLRQTAGAGERGDKVEGIERLCPGNDAYR
jgi:hypothetical protein